MDYLSKQEKARVLAFVLSNIDDNWSAIKNELLKEHSYKYYLLEKLLPIQHDINLLIALCKKE